MKYRIVTNGVEFKIQEKRWFFWKTYWEKTIGVYSYLRSPIFSTLRCAELKLKSLEEEAKRKLAKWVPVEEGK